jgi:hypothetical protein
MVAPPKARTLSAVRGWLLLVLGAGLIAHGAIEANAAEIGFGFTLLGVEPMTRARSEIEAT